MVKEISNRTGSIVEENENSIIQNFSKLKELGKSDDNRGYYFIRLNHLRNLFKILYENARVEIDVPKVYSGNLFIASNKI